MRCGAKSADQVGVKQGIDASGQFLVSAPRTISGGGEASRQLRLLSDKDAPRLS